MALGLGFALIAVIEISLSIVQNARSLYNMTKNKEIAESANSEGSKINSAYSLLKCLCALTVVHIALWICVVYRISRFYTGISISDPIDIALSFFFNFAGIMAIILFIICFSPSRTSVRKCFRKLCYKETSYNVSMFGREPDNPVGVYNYDSTVFQTSNIDDRNQNEVVEEVVEVPATSMSRTTTTFTSEKNE